MTFFEAINFWSNCETWLHNHIAAAPLHLSSVSARFAAVGERVATSPTTTDRNGIPGQEQDALVVTSAGRDVRVARLPVPWGRRVRWARHRTTSGVLQWVFSEHFVLARSRSRPHGPLAGRWAVNRLVARRHPTDTEMRCGVLCKWGEVTKRIGPALVPVDRLAFRALLATEMEWLAKGWMKAIRDTRSCCVSPREMICHG